MFYRFKLQKILALPMLIFTLIFCFNLKCQAEELDPIAAQHILTTKDTVIIPIEKLRPVEKVTPEGTAEAMYYMKLRMADKNYSKRAPLDVIERGDGTYSVIDGNRTLAALKELGAKNIPVIVHRYPYQKDVKNIKDLYALNEAAEGEFKTLMQSLQQELGGTLTQRPYIKKEKRVREKAKNEYGGDYSYITDMWAASLIFPNEEELLAAFEEIKKRNDVIWISDRWNNPLPQGYKDIQLCLILSNGAVVELQMHHQAILEVNNTIDHSIYEFVRANMKKPKMQDCVQRAKDCQKILYDSVWSGKFAELDAATKKALGQITAKLAKQTSPKKASAVLDELEKFLNDALAEKYNIAA